MYYIILYNIKSHFTRYYYYYYYYHMIKYLGISAWVIVETLLLVEMITLIVCIMNCNNSASVHLNPIGCV